MFADKAHQIGNKRLHAGAQKTHRHGGVGRERLLQAVGRKARSRHGKRNHRGDQDQAQNNLDRGEDPRGQLLATRQVLLVQGSQMPIAAALAQAPIRCDSPGIRNRGAGGIHLGTYSRQLGLRLLCHVHIRLSRSIAHGARRRPPSIRQRAPAGGCRSGSYVCRGRKIFDYLRTGQ